MNRRKFDCLEQRVLMASVQPGIIIVQEQGQAQPAINAHQARDLYGASQIKTFRFGDNRYPADGRGQKIVIVDAYDNPHVEADLHQYDVLNGLPDPVFHKITVGSPQFDKGWSAEIDLDVQLSHAIAPRAEIDLVEASDSFPFSLMDAVDVGAHIKGAYQMSLSWGGGDLGTLEDSHFTPKTPLTVFAASGDSGSNDGVSWPAASGFTIAVGGTTTFFNFTGNNSVQSETAWAGSGGGLSDISLPQEGLSRVAKFKTRAVPDISGDADPVTGWAIVDPDYSTRADGQVRIGGTSAITPYDAAMMALVNEGRSVAHRSPTNTTQVHDLIFSAPQSDFRDITNGSNGAFNAAPGYDLVTGRGSVLWNKFIPFAVAAPNKRPVIAEAIKGQGPLHTHEHPF